MRADARVVAVRTGGVTRLPVLRGRAPLLPRRTGPPGPVAAVHLVGGAAGPLGGDDLRLEVEVAEGARLCLRTVAASVALPGHDGTRSRMVVDARVAPGGHLAWLPEPLVAAAGCRHAAVTRIALAAGAHLVWREELVCGRYGEEPGEVTLRQEVTYAGRPLLYQDLTVGPEAPAWPGAAVLAGARAAGSLLRVDPTWADEPPEPPPPGPPEPPPPGASPPGPAAATMPLAGPAVFTTALAPDAATLRRCLTPGPEPGPGERRHRPGDGPWSLVAPVPRAP